MAPINYTGFPPDPAASLWKRTANMVIENPTGMYCVKQAFGTWCILSPKGNVLGMRDLWGDALSECDNVYLAWAERYCAFINTTLSDFYQKYKRHPIFELERTLLREGADMTYISLKELAEYKKHEATLDALESFEPELNYESGEYDP
jgi:hypothetical protein